MSGALLVIAPHADDDLLGAGAILRRAAAEGWRVGVVFVTDGSRSDPDIEPATLARRRRVEATTGLETLLGAAPPILFLDQPDGGLESTAVDVSAAGPLGAFAAQLAPETILVTDPADGHPDHKAAFGLATRLVSAGVGQRLEVMPVSQRVDGVFERRERFEKRPVGDAAGAKMAALACHASQLSSAGGFFLKDAVLADFREAEYVRTAYARADTRHDAIPAAHFDQLFTASVDPWGYDQEPYERDRFRRTVDALAGRRYASALELGCANGALTEHLAPLCDRLLTVDASAPALAAARARLGDRFPHVTLEQRTLPQETPAGPFDLIVASDMLYYLGLEGVVRLMAVLDQQAAPGCRLLLASYLGETDTRLTGEMASETAIAHLPGWRRVRAERTDKLRLDVLDRA